MFHITHLHISWCGIFFSLQCVRNNHAAVPFARVVYAAAGCPTSLISQSSASAPVICRMHRTTDQSIRAPLQSLILESFGRCHFARTYITVRPVGVEEAAGTVKPLMEIAFRRHCLNATTHRVRRKPKSEITFLILSRPPCRPFKFRYLIPVLEKWCPAGFSSSLVVHYPYQVWLIH